MDNHAVVSFCIPTYNRADMLEKLVLNILSSPNPHFEVIVMDNCSTDNTLSMLRNINDSRLHIYEHENPVPPLISWYDTYCNAQGDWIFHVNDRDWIETAYIDVLTEVLLECPKLNIGFVVAGEKVSQTDILQIYNEGYETIREFGLRFSHPTGLIIAKSAWNQIDNPRQFFDEDTYGIYPHGYLFTIIGNTSKGAHINFDICDHAHYSQRAIKSASTFYAKESTKKEWFFPESRFRLLTLTAENLTLIQDQSQIHSFLLLRYYQFFNCVTTEWYRNCNNDILKMRYNKPDLETNYLSLMANGFDYILLFRQFLEENKFPWANEQFYTQLCELDKKLLSQMLDWTNQIRFIDSK